MFLLGHACWSYLFSKSSARGLRVNMPAYLALLAGVLPDFDIYFQPLGLAHHTYTHSLLVIIPTVVVLTYFLGRFGLAFSIGIMSHLVGDYLVGTIPILYPVYPDWTVGLNLGIPSLADTLLEMGAFGLVMLYALQNRDYRLLLKPSRESLLLAIPLVAIDTLTILFAGDRNIPLVAFALLRKTLTIISIGHILLSALLALGVFQGLRWYYESRRGRGMSVGGGSGSNQGRE